MIVGVLGGTGSEGRGLALRWARAGHRVILGSRDAARAEDTAAKLRAALGADARGTIEGTDNEATARAAEVAALAVPFAAQRELLTAVRGALAGKVLIDAVVPLNMSLPHPYAPPSEGSAAEEAQAVVGPEVKVVAAFHHVAAHDLEHLDKEIAADVLFSGDDKGAKALVASLIGDIGARPIDVGALRHASVLEAMTVLLIQVNRRYKTKSAAVHITGIG